MLYPSASLEQMFRKSTTAKEALLTQPVFTKWTRPRLKVWLPVFVFEDLRDHLSTLLVPLSGQ